MKRHKLMKGNNIDLLKSLPDNSIDSVVTDPPYGLSFMNKKWDYDVPSIEFWTEVYRVLKPGGHVLSFGGTRTYHRMVVNMEDAGFEIRDQIMWLYASGFPKSHNIGKAVDKLEGNEREVVGDNPNHRKTTGLLELGFQDGKESSTLTKGTSPYEGWGTALKPANEPICLARKPLSEKSVAENVLKWKTGGINVDGCRVAIDGVDDRSAGRRTCNIFDEVKVSGGIDSPEYIPSPEGRFPANIIFECICDEVIKGEKGVPNDKGDIHTNPMCPCRLLDEQSGVSKSTGAVRKKDTETDATSIDYKHRTGELSNPYAGQVGGASRFFYQAKVSKAERNMGLDEFEEKESVLPGLNTFDDEGNRLRADGSIIPPLVSKNNHPTVKPINLMTYLCRLITPENGIVLDPFMGSGSTGIAAQLEGFRFCGMEMDEDYFKIAEARIENYKLYEKFIK